MSWFEIPFGVKVTNPKPVDARRVNNLDLPYTDTAELFAQNPPEIRIPNQEYDVYNELGGVDLWYFKDGITNDDLVKYVDEDIETFLRTYGDQVKTGQLTADNLRTTQATPVDATDVAPKSWLESTFLKLVGNQTLTGILTASNFKTQLAVPVADEDVVPKSYLDDNFINIAGNQTITGNIIIDGTLTVNGSISCNGIIPRSLTWAEIVLLVPEMHVGDTFIVTDEAFKEILIHAKSPDGSFWFVEIDDFGNETIRKVQ